jgi:hypothetical protein
VPSAGVVEGLASPSERLGERRDMLRRCRREGVAAVLADLQKLSLHSHIATSVHAEIVRGRTNWPEYLKEFAERLSAEPGLDQNLAAILGNAGIVMRANFQDRGDASYLQTAIWCFRETLKVAREDSIQKSRAMENLAEGFAARYSVSRERQDLVEASAVYRRLCARSCDPPEHISDIALRWAQLSAGIGAWPDAVRAYAQTLDAAERRARHYPGGQNRHDLVRTIRIASSGLAYALIQTDRLAEAGQAMERGNATSLLDLDSHQPLASALTFEEISEIAIDVPLVYYSLTSQGGVAIIVGPDHLLHRIELPHLTPESLQSRTDEAIDRATALTEQLVSSSAKQTEEGDLQQKMSLRQAACNATLACFTEVTRWLWDVAVSPVLGSGLPLTRMVIIPTEALSIWPLHAAWTEDPKTLSGRRYALDESCISYAMSARMLKRSRDMAAKATDDRMLVVECLRSLESGTIADTSVESEAGSIRFPGAFRSIRGRHATRKAILGSLADFPIMHCISEVTSNVEEPARNGIPMADDILSVNDLSKQELRNARLAVFSSRDDSIADPNSPDQSSSVVGGALAAGYAGVIGTHGVISAISAAVLVARFLELWRVDGLDIKSAFQQAQRWTRDATNAELNERFPDWQELSPPAAGARAGWRRTRRFEHPGYWASFAYYGM